MYQFILGKISTLSADPLASTLADMAPQGARHRSWLAGRTLLARALSPSPLPDIVYGEQGKPAFAKDHRLWFNLSHSGDDIALLVSDEGEVGCDIEVIRPRENWQALANAVFSVAEHAELEREAQEAKLPAFWGIWTRKEAIVKQRGGSAWQIVSIDSTSEAHSVSQLQFGSLSLAVCTPTPFTLTPGAIFHHEMSGAGISPARPA
ncbi:TPA: 4'-phosphopantetheinyl transferase AcpT [Enterobacter cloacae]|uniref:4'-phosphopantetheinyl transferase AcpT n=1 Tax=Enterobacter cloacae complex TaxID=354276 RepID=UPI00200DBA7D|nr:4'-phosphopantetheinyl transferase AcpT [Enterobacter cloacae]HBM7666011.1 4'-phosphopantetheinyl transferase AcpT [Enterobacter cloacae subsp. cloacae]MCM7172891.1 4'-phosphopantetheinyl transferase AcpT [Enterobacter cloacae]MDT0535695.1 4'-phosphopantetheinyl transferase AcpT [Enterobacter cloacae]UPW31761.1 4'-phosphopantetheinyl transferase AcpT [Enterobacter cloacae]HEC5294288.1 4'-phosphopantetheinyl transferase AcpT [Enterobacter cloacae]